MSTSFQRYWRGLSQFYISKVEVVILKGLLCEHEYVHISETLSRVKRLAWSHRRQGSVPLWGGCAGSLCSLWAPRHVWRQLPLQFPGVPGAASPVLCQPQAALWGEEKHSPGDLLYPDGSIGSWKSRDLGTEPWQYQLEHVISFCKDEMIKAEMIYPSFLTLVQEQNTAYVQGADVVQCAHRCVSSRGVLVWVRKEAFSACAQPS